MQMVGNLLSGFLMDRYGRKPTLVISSAIVIVASAILSFAPNYPLLLLGCGGGGGGPEGGGPGGGEAQKLGGRVNCHVALYDVILLKISVVFQIVLLDTDVDTFKLITNIKLSTEV